MTPRASSERSCVPSAWQRAARLAIAAGAVGGISDARGDVIVSGARTSSINLDSPPPEFFFPPSSMLAMIESGASVMVSNGDAMFGQNLVFDVTNHGSLRSMNGRGLNLQAGRSLVNSVTGLISGTSIGVNFQNGVGTVTNHGAIIAVAGQALRLEQGGTVENGIFGTIAGTTGGLHYQNGTASLTNAGSISASAGLGVRLEQGGTVENGILATISGTTGGLHYQNGTASLMNAGRISASDGQGVHLEQGGTVQNSGLVQGTTRGLHFQNNMASLTNSGTIEATNGRGVHAEPGGMIQNMGGTIRGTEEGIHFQNGTVTLTNSGTVEATAGTGVFIETGQATVNSTGTIRGAGAGFGVALRNGGSVTNSGAITTGSTGVALDFNNGGSLVNSGEIVGGGAGVHIRNNAPVTNSGEIRGGGFGINVEGGAGNVTTSGRIFGDAAGGVGVQFLNGGMLTNSGEIRGEGVGASSSNGGTIVTTGVIGGGVSSVRFVNGNGSLTLDTGGVLEGTAEGGGNSTTTLLGAGVAMNDFAAFGRLSMEGSAWTLAGRRGEFNEVFARSGLLTLTGGVTSGQTTIDSTSGSATALVTGLDAAWTNSGAFTIGQQGMGTLTVNDGATVTAGSFMIAAQAGSTGTLNIGAPIGLPATSPGSIGTAPVQFGAGTGALNFNHSTLLRGPASTYTFAAPVSGPGLINAVSGVTVMTADSSGFTGVTSVAGGSLYVNGMLGGSAAGVSGTLGGTGTILGDVTMADARLAPGLDVGTLTIGGNLILASGTSLDFDLGQADVVGGDANDLLEVGGSLTLDGSLFVTDVGGFGVGVYRLINYAGTLTDNGLDIAGLPSGAPGDIQVQTSVAQQVNLVVADGGTPGLLLGFWDGSSTTADGTINGGDGTWNNSNTNWTDMDGMLNGTWSSAFGVFAGQAGVVSVEGTVGTTGLQFMTDGYRVVQGPGGAIEISRAETIIRVDGGVTAEISAPIRGGGGLMKLDEGTLVLSGVNGYTGGTTVRGGTLSASSDENLGDASGPLTLDAGTLRATGEFSSGRSITLGVGSGTFDTVGSIKLTLTGAIGGDGDLVKTGTGTLRLGGVNTYSGNTVVAAGEVIGSAEAIRGDVHNAATVVFDQLAAGAFDGTVQGTSAGNGIMVKRGAGALTLGGFSTLNWTIEEGQLVSAAERFTGDVAATAGTMRFDQTMDARYDGVISGAGGFVKSGPGTLLLTGDHTYTGGTTVSEGTLMLGNGGISGSVVGNIVNNGTIVVNHSGEPTWAGSVTGTGSVHHVGLGTLTVTGENNYTGGTVISNGVVRIGNGGTTGSFTGDVVNDGELRFNRSDRIVFAGDMSGTGLLTQAGPGTLVLTGTNTHTGGTTVEAGTLQFGDGGMTGSIVGDIVNNGTVIVNRSDTIVYPGVVSGPGAVTLMGPGTLIVTGRNTFTGLATVGEGGVLQIGDGVNANGSIASDIENHGTVIVNRPGLALYPGVVSGPGSVVLVGDSTMIVTNDHTFTGGTTVMGGTLQIGDGGPTGSVAGTIFDEGRVVFNRTNELVHEGLITGGGSLVQSGAGTTVLTADHSYTGGTTILEGTLQVGNGGTTGSILGDVLNNAALAFNRSDAVMFPGTISGEGSVVQNGIGSLSLLADNTYEGGTVFNAGTVDVTRDANLGAVTGPLSFSGGTLRFGSSFEVSADRLINLNAPGGFIDTQSNTATIAEIIGEGGLTKRGAGTLRLTGDSTYVGPTSVEAGTLDVGGSIVSALTMAPETRLMGVGSVGPTVNSGTIAPGNSIGTLTVNGDLAHRAGTYEVEGEPGGTADLIHVNGAASLEGGGLSLRPLPGIYTPPLRYLILEATNGVSGQFVEGNDPAFLRTEIEYQPNQVFVVLEPVPFPSIADSYNTESVGMAIEASVPNASGELMEAFGQLATLDVDGALGAFNSMTGDMHPTTASLMLQGHAMLGQAVTRRLASRFSGSADATGSTAGASMMLLQPREGTEERLDEMSAPALTDDLSPALDNGFWGRIYGVLAGDREADANGPGVSYNAGGAAVGYDRRVGDNLVLGVSADYIFTRADYERDSGRADVHAYDFAIYAGYSHRNTYVDGVLAYAYLDNNTERGVGAGDVFETAEAQYGGHRFAAYLEAGHRFVFDEGIEVTPLASVQYTWLRQLDFTETGAGTLGLTADAFETQSFRTGLGVTVGKAFAWNDGTLRPEFRARWFHECLDQFASYDPAFIGSPGAVFNIRGTSADRDSLALGLGLELVRHGNFAMFADYDARFSSEESSHNVSLGMRFEW